MVQELKVEPREHTGSHQTLKLRRQGKVPCVLYGAGQPATPLVLDEHAFGQVMHAGVRIVNLKLSDRQAQALIKAVQYDPLGEFVLHVDFHEVQAGQKVRVRIPVFVKGVPKGHAAGGILNHALHELEVECLPTAIPEKVTLDVEPLELGQAIHVSDVALPEGVAAVPKGTEIVAACIEPRKVEEEAPAAEGALLEPEVIAEKKVEGEEAAVDEKKAAPAEAKKGEAKKGEAKKPEAKKPEGKK